MRNYELVCVLEAAPAEELKTIEQSVMAILEKREATVGKTESWGQRPLYHEAKKQNDAQISTSCNANCAIVQQTPAANHRNATNFAGIWSSDPLDIKIDTVSI